MNEEEKTLSDQEKVLLHIIGRIPHHDTSLMELTQKTKLASRMLYQMLGKLEAKGYLKLKRNESQRIFGIQLKKPFIQ